MKINEKAVYFSFLCHYNQPTVEKLSSLIHPLGAGEPGFQKVLLFAGERQASGWPGIHGRLLGNAIAAQLLRGKNRDFAAVRLSCLTGKACHEHPCSWRFAGKRHAFSDLQNPLLRITSSRKVHSAYIEVMN